jgi:lipoyl(octanoyl) transferase
MSRSYLPDPRSEEAALEAYLLGAVPFDDALLLQRRLVDQVVFDRSSAAVLLCEHPYRITVGREGSRAHIRCEHEELRARRWQIQWVNRGGGCMLHGPGQLSIYPILPLDRLGLGLEEYLTRFHRALLQVLKDFGVRGEVRPNQRGIWVGQRLIATFGVAVRDWVSYYGCALNVTPDLEPFRRVRCGGPDEEPMTSLERERRGRLSASLVRQRFLEYFAWEFGFARTSVFFHHPTLNKKAPSDAVATHP